MSVMTTVFMTFVTGSIIICLLTILITAIKKKTFSMILAIFWLLFVIVTFILTWVYYQNYDPLYYNGYLAELTYLFDGMKNDIMLAKVVLAVDVSMIFVAIIYIIIVIAGIISGIKKTAKNTKQYIRDKYITTKTEIVNFFHRNKKTTILTTTDNTDQDEMLNEESREF